MLQVPDAYVLLPIWLILLPWILEVNAIEHGNHSL